VGYGNGVVENISGNISETCKDGGKVTMEGHRNSPTLFRTIPSPTPYGLPFLEIGGLQIIPGTGKATDFKFCRNIHRVDRNKSP